MGAPSYRRGSAARILHPVRVIPFKLKTTVRITGTLHTQRNVHFIGAAFLSVHLFVRPFVSVCRRIRLCPSVCLSVRPFARL